MPQGFPEADTSKPCPNLEGAYRNLGAQQNNKGAFLSNVLEPFNAAFENTDDRALAYRRVALMNAIYADFTTQQSGALDVTLKAVDRDLILHPMPSSGQELTCKQGWLILTTKNSAIPFGLSKNTLAFAHARDGGLLVKNQKVDVISESLQAGQIHAEKALGWYYFPLHVAEEITPRW